MADILRGKDGYRVSGEFNRRTKAALEEGNQTYIEQDLVPYNAAKEPFIPWMKESIPKGAALLDVGCGFGRMIQHLVPPAGSYQGIDLVADRINWCETQFQGRKELSFKQVPSFEWGFTECFDAAICITVLQHLSLGNARMFLASLFKSLRPGGTAYLYEGRIIEGTMADAEKAYDSCPPHMIPKPLSELEAAAPFEWEKVANLSYELKKPGGNKDPIITLEEKVEDKLTAAIHEEKTFLKDLTMDKIKASKPKVDGNSHNPFAK